MLRTIALKMLFTAINMLITKELLTQIKEAVEAATSLQISGAEKKAKVVAELKDVQNELKKSFGNMGSAILNLAIEVAHAEFNVLKGKL